MITLQTIDAPEGVKPLVGEGQLRPRFLSAKSWFAIYAQIFKKLVFIDLFG